MLRMGNDDIRQVLEIDISGEHNSIDAVPLYEEMIVSFDFDEDLERSHVMYSFCTILGAEFEHQANVLDYELDKWAGKKWHKYKTEKKGRTDNDVKRLVESHSYYVKKKIKISKLRKLSKQFAFGGGKALDIKAGNLKQMIFNRNKKDDDFQVKENELDNTNKVKKSIKHRMKTRGGM